MFRFFSSKSESPLTKIVSTESLDSPIVTDIREHLQINLTQNAIILKKANLPIDISSIFEIEKNVHDSIHTPPSEKLDTSLHTFSPHSDDELFALIKKQYKNSRFLEKTHDVLLRRGIPSEKMPPIIDQILINMTHKVIENFKGEITQLLHEYEINAFDAENYIYWRLNEYTQDNTMYLITHNEQDLLSADNFFTQELFTLFQQQETSAIFDDEESVEARNTNDDLLNISEENISMLSKEQEIAAQEAEEKYKNLLNELENF